MWCITSLLIFNLSAACAYCHLFIIINRLQCVPAEGPNSVTMASFGGGYDYDGYHGSGRQPERGDYQPEGRFGGGGHRGADHDPERDELCHRLQMANRRMEESSASSLRTLHDTLNMGQDTTEELERQAETLDRTEKRLDEMHVDLDQSKRHMRNIKSPFGGVANYFARRKKLNEVTDPKLSKGAADNPRRKGSDPFPPPSSAGLKGTGNVNVDKNLDEMGKALHQLKGIGELIGGQLDDSSAQVDRIQYKVDRTDVKIKGVNRDIKKQLY